MIRNKQERAQVQSRQAHWRRMKKQITLLLQNWNMFEPGLLQYLEEEMRSMEVELRKFDSRVPETVDASSTLHSIDSIGQILVEARVGRGWTQEDLAKASNITQQLVSRYERTGYMNAKVATVKRITKALINTNNSIVLERKSALAASTTNPVTHRQNQKFRTLPSD